MRILYTNFHRAPGIGGHSTYILSLATALAQDHDVTVVAPEGSGLYRRSQTLRDVHAVGLDFPSRITGAYKAARQLRRILIEKRIQIIHVNGSSDHRVAMMARMGMGKRAPAIVFTKHNDQPIAALGAKLRIMCGTRHVIAVCEFVYRRVMQSPYRALPVTTIANGIDAKHFAKTNVQSNPSLKQRSLDWRRSWSQAIDSSSDPLILGSQAGTDGYKGWMDLVEAVSQLEPSARNRVRIALAGAWPSAAQKAEVERLGMSRQVFFTGPLDDVRPFLAALDAGFVLSWRIETISFACREMMAMGLPVMVSDHGGLPENIQFETDGWVVPARNLQAIGQCVLGMLQNSSSLAVMGKAAENKATRYFGIAPFVSATEAVYRTLV